jgi:hypothetical protein
MVRDGRSCPARQVGNLELDVRTNDLGCPVLYFPFMSCSDIHLGTKHSRAKRLCHMLEHTTTDTFFFVGGIIDVIGLKKKETSNWGPWQR